MDVETSEAIEGLHVRIDALDGSLRDEMSTMRADLRAEMSTMRDELRAEMSTMRADLRAEMSTMRDELRAEIRHVTIQVESLRDDIRIVAEGVATLVVKLDRLR